MYKRDEQSRDDLNKVVEILDQRIYEIWDESFIRGTYWNLVCALPVVSLLSAIKTASKGVALII